MGERPFLAEEPSEPSSLPPQGDPESVEPEFPPKLRRARYLVAGLLVMIIITVVASTYLRIEKQLRETREAQLKSILEENVHDVSTWFESQVELAQRIAQLPEVKALVSGQGTKELSEEDRQQMFRQAVSSLLRTEVIFRAELRSLDGAVRLSTSDESESDALPAGPIEESVAVQRTRLFPVHNQLFVEAKADIRTPDSKAVLTILVAPSESHLFPRAFDGGATYVFDRHGSLTRNLKNPLGLPPGALRAESAKEVGAAGIEDYRGLSNQKVVGAWRWLPRYQIGIATEVPRDEALGSIARLRRSFLVLLVLVGAAVLGFIALGRWTLRVREESLLMTRRLGRLARAIQPLSAALEHDPSAVVLVDAEGTVVYANAASHRVLGVSSPLLGQDVDAVFDNLHADLQAALISGHDSIVAQGAANDDETLLVSSRTLTIDGNPHFLYMLRPVTQQVRRQEVEHWKKLIRVLSHELNNALAPITSLLSSARKVNQMTHQDPRLGDIFENIAERTRHLVSFLEGYREVARLPLPDPKETSWESFLTGLESQKSFRRIGTTPKRPGYFDPIQLERVLVNVLNNAYEAGSRTEDIAVEVVEEPSGFRINVVDRGAGMPEPVLKQAMLPFFSTKRTGTGVGLALSREIIEAHGGQLTLTNREGGGLLVSCFLPHRVPPAPHPSRSRVPISPPNPSEDSDPPKVSTEGP